MSRKNDAPRGFLHGALLSTTISAKLGPEILVTIYRSSLGIRSHIGHLLDPRRLAFNDPSNDMPMRPMAMPARRHDRSRSFGRVHSLIVAADIFANCRT